MTNLGLLNVAAALGILAKTKNGPQTTLAIARLRSKVDTALQPYFKDLAHLRDAAGLKEGEGFPPDSSEAKALAALLRSEVPQLESVVPLSPDAAAAAASAQEQGGDALLELLNAGFVADQ